MKVSSVSSGPEPRLQRVDLQEPALRPQPAEVSRFQPNVSAERKPESVSQLERSVADVEDMVDELNEVFHYVNERLQFSVHEGTNRVMVKVVDRDTDEVIREVPPEKFLDLVAKLQELVGIFVDKKA